MKREVDYKKVVEKLEEWLSKNPHGSVWTSDILSKLTEIRKQGTKKEEK